MCPVEVVGETGHNLEGSNNPEFEDLAGLSKPGAGKVLHSKLNLDVGHVEVQDESDHTKEQVKENSLDLGGSDNLKHLDVERVFSSNAERQETVIPACTLEKNVQFYTRLLKEIQDESDHTKEQLEENTLDLEDVEKAIDQFRKKFLEGIKQDGRKSIKNINLKLTRLEEIQKKHADFLEEVQKLYDFCLQIELNREEFITEIREHSAKIKRQLSREVDFTFTKAEYPYLHEKALIYVLERVLLVSLVDDVAKNKDDETGVPDPVLCRVTKLDERGSLTKYYTTDTGIVIKDNEGNAIENILKNLQCEYSQLRPVLQTFLAEVKKEIALDINKIDIEAGQLGMSRSDLTVAEEQLETIDIEDLSEEQQTIYAQELKKLQRERREYLQKKFKLEDELAQQEEELEDVRKKLEQTKQALMDASSPSTISEKILSPLGQELGLEPESVEEPLSLSVYRIPGAKEDFAKYERLCQERFVAIGEELAKRPEVPEVRRIAELRELYHEIGKFKDILQAYHTKQEERELRIGDIEPLWEPYQKLKDKIDSNAFIKWRLVPNLDMLNINDLLRINQQVLSGLEREAWKLSKLEKWYADTTDPGDDPEPTRVSIVGQLPKKSGIYDRYEEGVSLDSILPAMPIEADYITEKLEILQKVEIEKGVTTEPSLVTPISPVCIVPEDYVVTIIDSFDLGQVEPRVSRAKEKLVMVYEESELEAVSEGTQSESNNIRLGLRVPYKPSEGMKGNSYIPESTCEIVRNVTVEPEVNFADYYFELSYVAENRGTFMCSIQDVLTIIPDISAPEKETAIMVSAPVKETAILEGFEETGKQCLGVLSQPELGEMKAMIINPPVLEFGIVEVMSGKLMAISSSEGNIVLHERPVVTIIDSAELASVEAKLEVDKLFSGGLPLILDGTEEEEGVIVSAARATIAIPPIVVLPVVVPAVVVLPVVVPAVVVPPVAVPAVVVPPVAVPAVVVSPVVVPAVAVPPVVLPVVPLVVPSAPSPVVPISSGGGDGSCFPVIFDEVHDEAHVVAAVTSNKKVKCSHVDHRTFAVMPGYINLEKEYYHSDNLFELSTVELLDKLLFEGLSENTDDKRIQISIAGFANKLVNNESPGGGVLPFNNHKEYSENIGDSVANLAVTDESLGFRPVFKFKFKDWATSIVQYLNYFSRKRWRILTGQGSLLLKE